MTPRLAPLCLLLCLAACQCGIPGAPTPVTVRVKNGLGSPIFVDATAGELGVRIQRKVGGQWSSFVEAPPCECLACDRICGGVCSCPTDESPRKVVMIPEGKTQERQWSGVVQLSGRGSCFRSPDCLAPQNPPVNETFRAQLCYALSVPGVKGVDAGTPVPGALPEEGTICTATEFQVQDQEVEVAPTEGRSCTGHVQCILPGEYCFGGACTAACPSNDFPTVGPGWQIRIPEPDNSGFFAVAQSGGRTVYTGKGTASSVSYQNGTMILRLSRPAPGGGNLVGTLYVTLPPGVAVPLTQGETLDVKVVDGSATMNPDNRAALIRSADGALLLAADSAQNGFLLSSADTAPFTVSSVENFVGCEQTECGKRLFKPTLFVSSLGDLELRPGRAAQQVVANATFNLLNVGNGSYASTRCSLTSLAPYAIANARVDGM